MPADSMITKPNTPVPKLPTMLNIVPSPIITNATENIAIKGNAKEKVPGRILLISLVLQKPPYHSSNFYGRGAVWISEFGSFLKNVLFPY